MSMNDTIKAYRAQKGEWDDLREQRIFRSVQERRRQRPNQRIRILLAGGAVAAVVIVAYSALLAPWLEDPREPAARAPLPETPAVATESPSSLNASVITLAHAGRVTLSEGADVSILSKSDEAVVLEQEEGAALYDIIHRDNHSVTVLAAGVAITVVGTLFEVAIEGETVRVEVKRGVVQVDDGHRQVTLHAQEALSVTHARKSIPDASQKGPPKQFDDFRMGAAGDGEISTQALFEAVDEARRHDDWAAAARLLKRIIERNESRFSQASAQFTLGKVERARGRHQSAARLFEKCARRAPIRSLREDALAEAALSWHAAENDQQAKRVARTYLETYPKGMYVTEMNGLID
jgi:transmembrane sensor